MIHTLTGRLLLLILIAASSLAACSPVPAAPTRSVSSTQTTPAGVTPVPSPTTTLTSTPALPPTATLAPSPTPTPEPTLFFRSLPAATPPPYGPYSNGQVYLYPGPLHYEGDLLSIEIVMFNYQDYYPGKATLFIDDGPGKSVDRRLAVTMAYYGLSMLLPEAWDTTGQAGRHTLRVKSPVLDGQPLDITFEVDILPAELRPLQEDQLAWVESTLTCCRLYYLSGTAADRDHLQIEEDLQANIEAVEEVFGVQFKPQAFTFYLVDNVWGNGGFATRNHIVINYLDRNYAPGAGLDQLVRHEAGHLALAMLGASTQMGPIFGEGIPVYVAGGHFKPEPLRQRAAALLALDQFVPLDKLHKDFGALQHEARYLESAAVVAYLVETYGWDALIGMLTGGGEASDPWSWVSDSLVTTYGLTVDQLEADVRAWLEASDPDEQVEDLRLTMLLSNVRRAYQACCAPSLDFDTLNPSPKSVRCLPVFVREGRQPENLAIESMLVEANHSIITGDFTGAELLINALQPAIERLDFSAPPASDYLEIAALLYEQGWEAVRITLFDDLAQVTAIRHQPLTEELLLKKIDSSWQLETSG